jgi:hypothetical protein
MTMGYARAEIAAMATQIHQNCIQSAENPRAKNSPIALKTNTQATAVEALRRLAWYQTRVGPWPAGGFGLADNRVSRSRVGSSLSVAA